LTLLEAAGFSQNKSRRDARRSAAAPEAGSMMMMAPGAAAQTAKSKEQTEFSAVLDDIACG
jgi:ribosomal protein L7/L12